MRYSPQDVDLSLSEQYKDKGVLITLDKQLLAKESDKLNPSVYEIAKDVNASEVVFLSDEDFIKLREEILQLIEQQIKLEEETEEVEEELPESEVDKLIEFLLVSAVKKGASDVHITPRKKQTVVEFRENGILTPFKVYPSSRYAERIINKLKSYAGLDIANSLTPQDGKFRKKLPLTGEIEVRLSTVPVYRYGERAVMRIQRSEKLLEELSLEDLGFEKEDLEKYKKTLSSSYGMIIDTGGTGEGKSTTLILSLIEVAEKSKGEKAILSVEDPVEVDLSSKGIVQVEVDEKQNRTYPVVLRSFLRQDPDVIMVGEIRDEDTAQISVRASLTGHLVLTTLHANDSVGAIERLKDLGVSPILIASTIKLLLAQRLIRKLCPYCKEKRKIPVELVKKYNLPFDEAYYPVGCDKCQNGYLGRTAVIEVLELDSHLKELIVKESPPTEIKRYLKEKGFRNLWSNGLRKVERGETSLEELLRKITPDEILNSLREETVLEVGTVLYPERKVEVEVKGRKGYLFDLSRKGLSVILPDFIPIEPNREVELKVAGRKIRFIPKSFRKVEGGGFIVGGIYSGELLDLLEEEEK